MTDEKKAEKKAPANPRNAAYGKALAGLKASHEEEFQTLYEAACAEYGVTYKRRLSAQEKAEIAQAERLAKAQAKAAALKAEFGAAIFD